MIGMTGQVKRKMIAAPDQGGMGIPEEDATPAAVAEAETFASQVYQSVERSFRGMATDLYPATFPASDILDWRGKQGKTVLPTQTDI